MKTSKFIIFIALYFLTLSDLFAGEFYKWTDREGTDHFTDNYLSIPPEYRYQAKVRVMKDVKEAAPESHPPVEPSKSITEKAAAEGEGIFNEKCSKCHSLTGKNPDDSATQLVGLLNSDRFKESPLSVTEENIRQITQKGGWDDMPGFPELTDKDMDELMKYLTPYMKKK